MVKGTILIENEVDDSYITIRYNSNDVTKLNYIIFLSFDVRIRFGKIALKCRDCPVTCHTDCRIQVISLPCVCGKSAILFGGSVSTVV